ncbi:hypothetical protein FKM82_013170 [Ascaphus truei]
MASAPSAGLTIPWTGDSLHSMHVTRPKSAKGRTRTNPQTFSRNHPEAYSCRASPPPTRLSLAGRAPRIGQEDVPEIRQQLPSRPPSSSLNRYKVLPSIGTAGGGDRAEELVRETASMRLATEQYERPVKALYRGQTRTGEAAGNHRPSVGEDSQGLVNMHEPSDQEPRLLLAIRSASGQRFERYFRPSDTLHAVLAAAEAKTGVSCNNCSVESMEVPRRRFPDLSRTLQECGIPNKSVLCIQQMERD